MAARRLIAVLIVVLVVSTVAAALVAPIQRETDTTSTTGPKAPPSTQEGPRNGRLIQKSVQATSRKGPAVRLRPGDQLELTVHVRRAAQVEIVGLGLLEDATPDAPAHFSLIAPATGRFEVRGAGTGPIATISVERPPKAAGGLGEAGAGRR